MKAIFIKFIPKKQKIICHFSTIYGSLYFLCVWCFSYFFVTEIPEKTLNGRVICSGSWFSGLRVVIPLWQRSRVTEGWSDCGELG